MKRGLIAGLCMFLLAGCARVTTAEAPSPEVAPPPQAAAAPQGAPPSAARPPAPKETAAATQKKPTATAEKKPVAAPEKKPTAAPEKKQVAAVEKKPAPPAPAPAPSGGLTVSDLRAGSGPAAQNGQRLRVKYVGTLTDGTVFDQTGDGEPFTFTLGGNQVIEGWEKGMVGMKVGGKRKLVIPPELGYGKTGVPPTIPPNAKLIFEVELLAIE